VWTKIAGMLLVHMCGEEGEDSCGVAHRFYKLMHNVARARAPWTEALEQELEQERKKKCGVHPFFGDV